MKNTLFKYLKDLSGFVKTFMRSPDSMAEPHYTDEQPAYLDQALAAILGINRLILRETERDRLLMGACRLLVEAGGFERALIVLMVDGVPTAPYYQVRRATGGGIEVGLTGVKANTLEAGFLPECGRLCLSAEGMQILTDCPALCADCPFKSSCQGASALAMRIAFEGRNLGWLNVVLPAGHVPELKLVNLICEVAFDLAYALHNLEKVKRSQPLEVEPTAGRQVEEESPFAQLFYFNPVPMAVVCGADGRFVEANVSFLTESGFLREEIIGANAVELNLFVDEVGRGLPYACLQEGALIKDYEASLRCKDGGSRVVLISSSQMPYGGRECLLWSITDITWQKRAEAEARLHEANFRGFFDAMQDMVLVGNYEGKVFCANSALVNKLGYNQQELDAMGLLSIHPLELQQEAINVFSAMIRGERDNCPLPIQRKDGTLMPVETRVTFGKWNGADCIFGIIKDLSSEQEAQQRFERLFRHNPTLMALSSLPDRHFVDVNEAFLVTLGYTRDEIIGNTSAQLGLFLDPGQQAEVIEQLAAGGRVTELEVKVRGRDGRVLDGLFSGELIVNQGKHYFLTVMTDITPRKRAEAALLQTLRLQRLLAEISSAGVEPVEVELFLSESLALMGQVLDVSRAYIFEIDEAAGVTSNTHEWCAPGVTPQRAKLQGLSMNDVGWRVAMLHDSEVINFEDIEEIPDALIRALLRVQGVRSLLVTGIWNTGRLSGFMGFDECRDTHAWPEEHVALIRNMAEVLAAVVSRTSAEATLRETADRRRRQAEIVSRAAIKPAVAAGDLPKLSAWLTEEVALEFGISRVGVWIFEDDGSRLVNLDNYDTDTRKHASGAVLLEHEYRDEFECLRRDKYVNGNDPLHDPRLAGYVQDYLVPNNITSMLDAAIRVGDRTLGTLCFEYVAVPHTWTEDEITFACQLADQVALTVANGWRRQAEAETRAARRQAESANRAKSEFLANMSHELRTPLNAILGLTEGLLEQVRGPLNERQQASLRTVEASGRHLLELINDVLDLARIEAGRLEIAKELTLAREVCEASLALVREQAASKGVALELVAEPDLLLQADPRRLKQMLVNLLSNGVKFTPPGGRVSLAVDPSAGSDALVFTVTDTGLGIRQEEQVKLFQPFIQLDAGLSRLHEGSGLGLVLVRRLADQHGGGVTLVSAPGQGSRFSVTLPVGVIPAQVPASPGVPLIRPARPTVLVIEDSPESYNQLADYLAELGYTAIPHDRGVGAVAAVRERQPGLVLLDILLPDISGWEVLAKLKGESATREIPVLVVSVVDEPARALANGAVGHLLKPVSRAGMARVLAVQEASTQIERRRILLAEDNEWNIQTVRDYLQDHGLAVEVARDGLEALERARNWRPELVLMDIQMPRLDGLETIRQLRLDPAFTRIPIVALTALAMPGDEERCREAGANAYLSKPVGMNDLLETISKFLAKSKDVEGARI